MALADAILRQIQTAGQPKKFWQETTETSREPFDVGSLGLILALLMEDLQKPKIPTDPLSGPEAGGIAPGTGLMGMGNLAPDLGAPLPVAPPQQNFGGMNPQQLLMMLMGGGGGGGF